jgi:RimJ/RimL family protein N-acetyltransferase
MKEQETCPFIEGKVIDLLPLNPQNISLYAKWTTIPKVRIFSRNIIPKTPEEIKKWLEPKEGRIRREIQFEIWHKGDKKSIGTCGIFDINYFDMKAWMGLTIGESEYWGRGICTEVTKLLVEYVFNELNLNKINAGIFSPNEGSFKCAEKSGFFRESVSKQDVFIEGRFLDTYYYSLLKEDWKKVREK